MLSRTSSTVRRSIISAAMTLSDLESRSSFMFRNISKLRKSTPRFWTGVPVSSHRRGAASACMFANVCVFLPFLKMWPSSQTMRSNSVSLSSGTLDFARLYVVSVTDRPARVPGTLRNGPAALAAPRMRCGMPLATSTSAHWPESTGGTISSVFGTGAFSSSPVVMYVFPRPISSARMPPQTYSAPGASRPIIQFTASIWCG